MSIPNNSINELDNIFIYYQWQCLADGAQVSEIIHLGKSDFAKATFKLKKGETFYKVVKIDDLESQQEVHRYFNNPDFKLIKRKLTNIKAYLEYIYSVEEESNFELQN
ncbi:MAG: hypothetical protein HXY49_04495 [Ignavibacteriaceae bacterium]|nr:hypothetical protein [Ignavibacteriaceae bacterium]